MGGDDERQGDNNTSNKPSPRFQLIDEPSGIYSYTWDSPPKSSRQLGLYEIEALRLFASGLSADEMARALSVSRSMANHYLRVAGRKLGARNRVHAVALAVRMGLIKPTRPKD